MHGVERQRDRASANTRRDEQAESKDQVLRRNASAHDLQMVIHGARNTSLTSVARP